MNNNYNYGNGAKVLNNNEWTNLNNAIGNIQFGDNGFLNADVTELGINIPNDSFFFPHVASISGDYQHAIIGQDREEEYYPYIDSVPVSRKEIKIKITQKKGAGGFAFINWIDLDTFFNSVLFPEMNSIEPFKPTGNNGSLVGYQWDLRPTCEITAISEELDKNLIYATITMEASGIFDGDIYTEEYNDDPLSQSPTVDEGNLTFYYSGLVNNALQNSPEFSGYYPLNLLGDETDDPSIKNTIIKVPVARYDWNESQSGLERVIQLYFGGSAGGGKSGRSINAPEDFYHPFQTILSGSDSLSGSDYLSAVVGYRRELTDYQFEDSITIIDPDSDYHVDIEYPDPEPIEVTSGDYVYYELYKNGSQWESELKTTQFWPPSEEFAGNILKSIGYVSYNTTLSALQWGQHLYDCPTEPVASLRGEFEPWYELSGFVTIGYGTVETLNGDTQFIPERSLPLNTPTDVYIKCVSTPNDGLPVTSINGLLTGTYPGMYSSDDDDYYFNYKIGEITGGAYIPCHKGRLQIDNTLLMPEIDEDFGITEENPRMMAFHDSQPTSVGNSDNPCLLSAKFLDVEIQGGGVRKIKQDDDVQFFGKTESGTSFSLTWNVSGGEDFGEGRVELFGEYEEYDYEKGLMQQRDISPDDSLYIEAGDNIKIDWDGNDNIVTISGKDSTEVSARGLWIEKDADDIIYHKESPVTSTADDEHWRTATSANTIYFDETGHAWRIDDELVPSGTLNYAYEHCSDTDSYSNLVFSSEQSNIVLSVSGECYKFIGEVVANPTTPAPIIDATYDSCSACTSGSTNEQWKRCDDDTNIAVLSPAHCDVDYAFLCDPDDSKYERAYNSGNTALAATNPTVLKQCGIGTPISCDDLVGWPASDDFGGSGCNSSAVNDTNFDIRWEFSSPDGDGSGQITGGAYVFTIDGGGNGDRRDGIITNQYSGGNIGDFTCSVDFTINNPTSIVNPTYNQVFEFRMQIGSDDIRIVWDSNPVGGFDYNIDLRSPSSNVYGTDLSSGTLTISRIGSTVTLSGLGKSVNFTNSGAISNIKLRAFTNASSGQITQTVDNFVLEDGSSDDLYIDPETISCT